MSTSNSDAPGATPARLTQRPFLGTLLCVWILLTALFFFIRFTAVFFLSYRDVIAALFRQFFDS